MRITYSAKVESVTKDGDGYRVDMVDCTSGGAITLRDIPIDVAPYFGQAIGRGIGGRGVVKVTVEVDE